MLATLANALVTGVWQHIAATYDKTSGLASLYINGALITQTNLGSFTPQTSFTNLLLGARTTYFSTTSPGNVFSGKMDELSLYNRALTASEIQTIYQAGSNGKCPLPPFIISQPTNQTVSVSNTATFKVVASGTPALLYQWSFSSNNIVNATNATLTLTNVQLANAGNYSVLVANNYGSTNSSNAVLTVQAAPNISAQPTNVTVTAGGTAIFSVTVSGTPTLNYQWRFNGTNIAGATNLVLTLANVQLTNGGNYSVRVTNQFGSAISSNGLLTVQAPPIITTQPSNLTVNVGDTAVFNAAVTGSLPLSFQWSFNGLNNSIVGATNASLAITNVQLVNAGVYVLTVTNLFGLAVSSNATLTVIDVLDHFVWSQIPSPRFVNVPFAVTIQAQDSVNQLFTNFNGNVLLTDTNGIAVSPAVSSSFVRGMWTGPIAVAQTATNLILRADDGVGHAGYANAINVIHSPSLAMVRSGGFLLIFWPVDPAGFALETTGSLSPAQWVPVPASPFPIGNQYLELIQITDTNQFFRLQFDPP